MEIKLKWHVFIAKLLNQKKKANIDRYLNLRKRIKSITFEVKQIKEKQL